MTGAARIVRTRRHEIQISGSTDTATDRLTTLSTNSNNLRLEKSEKFQIRFGEAVQNRGTPIAEIEKRPAPSSHLMPVSLKKRLNLILFEIIIVFL
jgi:hypothetical protein